MGVGRRVASTCLQPQRSLGTLLSLANMIGIAFLRPSLWLACGPNIELLSALTAVLYAHALACLKPRCVDVGNVFLMPTSRTTRLQILIMSVMWPLQQLLNILAFWMRGLCPNIYTQCEELPFAEPLFQRFGSLPPGVWPPGSYYTDGSGGRFNQVPQLRRCALALVRLEAHAPTPTFAFGVATRLPGSVQTVPRAELLAVVLVLEVTDPNPVHVTTDAWLVVLGVRGGVGWGQRSNNFDLWERFWVAVEAKGGVNNVVVVVWTKANPSAEYILQHCLDLHTLVGNVIADSLASSHAAEVQVSEFESSRVLANIKLVQTIQLRLLAIARHMLECYARPGLGLRVKTKSPPQTIYRRRRSWARRHRRLPAPVVPMFSPSGRPLRRLVRKTTFKPAHCALARPGSSLPSPACSLPRGDGDGAVRGRDGQ